jgi:hypothetical protein
LPTNPTSPTNHVYPTEPTCYALTVTLPCAGSHTTSVCTYPSDWIGLTAQSHNIGNYTPLTNGSSAPVCNGYSVDFQAVTQVAYAPYIWTVNNITMPTTSWYSSYSSPGFDMSMGQSFAAINIKPKTAGLYTVTVSGTGICSSSNVSATFTFNYDPNVYCRPANAGPEPVAMPDPTTKLSVYPNPAAEQVSIPAGLQRAQVLDAMNHSVLERSQPGAILDVRALPEGLYQLRLVQPDGRVQTQRLVIKH